MCISSAFSSFLDTSFSFLSFSPLSQYSSTSASKRLLRCFRLMCWSVALASQNPDRVCKHYNVPLCALCYAHFSESRCVVNISLIHTAWSRVSTDPLISVLGRIHILYVKSERHQEPPIQITTRQVPLEPLMKLFTILCSRISTCTSAFESESYFWFLIWILYHIFGCGPVVLQTP